MYQLRYISYVFWSLVAGIITNKFIPQFNIIDVAIWFMLGNILFEILNWKYDTEDSDGSF